MAVQLTVTEENGLSVVNNPVVIEVVNATAPGGGSNIVYQRAESLTTDTSATLTDQSVVLTVGPNVTLTLPDSTTNDGQQITVVAGDLATVVAAAGTDTISTNLSTYAVPVNNVRTFTATQVGANHTWLVTNANGNASDIPAWVGQSITAGYAIKMGSTQPEWGVVTPGAHAATHAATGTDAVSLSGTQITSGVVAPARLGTGTADAYHFLDGTGTWTDDVPVLVPCKNTTAATIAKGAPVYVTGTVGSTSTIEIAPADADAAATMPSIGLLAQQLVQNATGYVVVVGSLRGLDTSTYSINQALYVSTTAGQLTSTKPTGASELIQNIGRVTRVNASNGEILVLGPGRTNDVPNTIDAGKLTSGTIATARLASTGTASSSTFLRGDQSWVAPTTVANDTLWDAAGDLAVGSGADAAAKLSKGTRTQSLVVGASTLEWDANHYNGGNFVSATINGAIAETVPAGAGFGATTGGGSGVAHLHGIYLPKGVTITTISFVSGATAAGTPTNQWFALCDSSRTALRVTANDTTTAWGTSTVKSLNLTSTFTTTYSGLHYLACCVTATTVPTFRGANAGTFTGVATQSFTSTTGLTTPVAEGTTFAASTGRLSQAMGIVS